MWTGTIGTMAALAALLLAFPAYGRPAERSLLQSTDPPGNVRVLRQLHGVGTQNYTSDVRPTGCSFLFPEYKGSDSKYQAAGAVADLYGNSTTKAGRHYFIDGQPYFEVFGPDGNVIGSVRGRVQTTAPVASAPNDGGFGSIPRALLVGSSGTGVWQNVNFIQRVNTLGGVVPSGLFTLPSFQGVNNFLLAVPYQADYIFYVPS